MQDSEPRFVFQHTLPSSPLRQNRKPPNVPKMTSGFLSLSRSATAGGESMQFPEPVSADHLTAPVAPSKQ
jgi:hypothetical protein